MDSFMFSMTAHKHLSCSESKERPEDNLTSSPSKSDKFPRSPSLNESTSDTIYKEVLSYYYPLHTAPLSGDEINGAMGMSSMARMASITATRPSQLSSFRREAV